MAKNSRTGSRNKKAVGGVLKGAKRVMPWGPIIPNRRVGHTNGIGQSATTRKGRVRGSSIRKPRPDPQLFGMKYPKNQPSQWPVEPDFENHTLAPGLSGLNDDNIAENNDIVNAAFKRAGYPEA